ncbi:hypothetical protein MNBD_GAMMA12-1146 [hydrothermal vent metagenome]|uniref:Transposase n=1 Tax=hydrothermal vent metagenome TaxID=652676 RepID=A0A3B0YT34_9ZZZZ
MDSSSKATKNRQFWIDHVNTWSTSGLSQAEYCRQHDLPMGKFYNWKLKLKSKTVIPVVVQPDKGPSHTESSFTDNSIEITLANNIRCRFPDSINLDTASDWIRVLSNIQ